MCSFTRGYLTMMNWSQWLRGANASIYSCTFLASWSGRMWVFSLSLFMITVSPKSLQLSGTYGLCMGAAVLVFGSIIGDWVDRTARFKAATLPMICQNALIATCACVVLTLIMLLTKLGEITDWLRHLLYAIMISLSVCSRLMKEARIIAVERDWIVEMCSKDEHQLAVMTSSLQRIDLLTKILAPIVTGQIMTFAGLKIGCGFIAGWSLVSLCVEYCLLRRVYNIVPALKMVKHQAIYAVVNAHKIQAIFEEEERVETENSPKEAAHKEIGQAIRVRRADGVTCTGRTILWQMLTSFLNLHRGLKTYFFGVTRWPGLALACLYLTVLTMGDITVGYGTMQGLSGSILGIMMALGACFGVVATFTYPFIVKKLGLSVTGVMALGLQVTCLTLCVISVWLPGSPFDLSQGHKKQVQNESLRNCSNGTREYNETKHEPGQLQIGVMTSDLSTNMTCVDVVTGGDSSLSVWVMIAGIVLARFGLWTAHMAIVQIFLENVPIEQRGIVNGFQTSLNQLMGFLKYALVVALPHPYQFGLLVFISYASICTAWMFMGVNAVRTPKRGRIKDVCVTGVAIINDSTI